jgi:hypothetical protein
VCLGGRPNACPNCGNSELINFREKVRAADVLLGRERGVQATQITPTSAKTEVSGTLPAFTPVELYWPAIIESLIELGGTASRDESTAASQDFLRGCNPPVKPE